MEHNLQNALFLESIRKTRPLWKKNNKAFARIVAKMENGKSLTKQEFDNVYWALWIRGHGH